MVQFYYGTVPSLAWILAHYFYGGTHFTWLSEEYFPYRLNPKSSNPHLIYQDLYQPWRDRDDFDKFVNQARINLRKGVMAQENAGNITPILAARLKDICDKADISFLYPIVYRVDVGRISPPTRLKIAGSGLHGSRELLLPDLLDSEFDILFLDDLTDVDLVLLVRSEVDGIASTSSTDALNILERRC